MPEAAGFSHISGQASHLWSTASARLSSFQLSDKSSHRSSYDTSGLQKLCSNVAWIAGGIGKVLLGLVVGSIAVTLALGLLSCIIARLAIGLVASIIGIIPGLGSHFLEPLIGKLGALPCGIGGAICLLGISALAMPFLDQEGRQKFMDSNVEFMQWLGSYETWVEASHQRQRLF